MGKKKTRMAAADEKEVLKKASIVVAYDEDEGDAFVVLDRRGNGVGLVTFEHALDRLKLAKDAGDVAHDAREGQGGISLDFGDEEGG